MKLAEKNKSSGGKIEEKKPKKLSKPTVSCKQWMNAAFSDICLPLLSLRGEKVTRNELTEG